MSKFVRLPSVGLRARAECAHRLLSDLDGDLPSTPEVRAIVVRIHTLYCKATALAEEHEQLGGNGE